MDVGIVVDEVRMLRNQLRAAARMLTQPVGQESVEGFETTVHASEAIRKAGAELSSGIAGVMVFEAAHCERCGKDYRKGAHYCMSLRVPRDKNSKWIGWVDDA
jgi:hypothetical protein